MEINLKQDFLFTQQSLETFKKCPLKFKRIYIEKISWDNIPDPVTKKNIEKGKDFHLLAQRYFLGIPSGLDKSDKENSELNTMLERLEAEFQIDPEATYLPEYKLRLNSTEIKLEANFDLLLVKGDRIQIWDWKTHSKGINRRLQEKKYIESYQSMVYLYLLGEENELAVNMHLPCDNISMHYWHAGAGITEIAYNYELHEKYKNQLITSIKGIYEFNYNNFEQEKFRNHCKACQFNWLCNREPVDFNLINDEENEFYELEEF